VLGLDLPRDLGLCSCVDSSIFSLTTPEVTGIVCHPRTIGGTAVALLIDLVEGREPAQDAVLVPTELNIRRSTLRSAAPA
jgi:DNA-binding LacI/PurR family transcriptional regulator